MIIEKQERIAILDAFRGIAVLLVVAYHFYWRFTPPVSDIDYLPYKYDPFHLTRYGFFGVQFFFVISGFVIFHTLQKCKTFKEFMMKRLTRLMPSLMLCSLLTFFLVESIDQEYRLPIIHSKTYLNFIPSLTFIPPACWNSLTGRDDIAYIDGAYWSLFAEVSFYIVGGCVFFFGRNAFSSNWIRITAVMVMVRVLTSPKLQFLFPEPINSFFDVLYRFYFYLNINYWVYFALGIFFYSLYTGKNRPAVESIVLIMWLTLTELYFLGDHTLRILFVCIAIIFLVFIYKDDWLWFMKNKVALWMGAISYPLYLLHENIGLIFINAFSGYTTHDILLRHMPLFVILVVSLMSYTVYRYFEMPVIAFIRLRVARMSFSKENLPKG